MKADSRLSRMLHVLLHMARHDQPFTSEQIARMLATNPVVVRRTLAGLREAGYVRSENGHGGGWTIACGLQEITLLDVHHAVGGPQVFAIGTGNAGSPCAVEQAVSAALSDTLRQAEALLVEKLAAVTLADLLEDFDSACRAGAWGTERPQTQQTSRISPLV